MTMTPDELRALADCLDDQNAMQRTARRKAADYLRACADAQPVAWVDVTDSYGGPYIFHGKELLPAGRHDLYTHPAPAVPAGWKLVPVEPTPEMLQAGANVMEPNGIGWYDADISRAEYRAMLAAAPAAPQAEPKRPAFLDEIDRAKEHVASWPQWMKDAMVSAAATLPVTEPKRGPLSDEQIDVALQTDPAMILALMSGEMTVGELKSALRRLARTVERAHKIGGSDAAR